MNKNPMSKKFRSRMVRSGVLASAGYGLLFGACAEFVAALTCWLLDVRAVWLPLSVGLGVALAAGIVTFFVRFRPNDRRVAHRMDSMGLEERTVTMMELEKDDSPIAKLQREDTVKRVSEVTKEQINRSFPLFVIRRGVLAVMIVSLLMAAGMTTVMGLTEAGVITPPDILTPEEERNVYVNLIYGVQGGGDIEGDAEQSVRPGEDGTQVVAVAEDGWMFVRWSDGNRDPARTDRSVTEDMEITAIFEEVPEDEDKDDNDSKVDGDEEGDYDKDLSDPNENDGNGMGGSNGDGGEGDGEGDNGDGSGKGDGGQQGDGKGNGRGDGAGGGWSDGNQIIDGKTDYRDVYDIYYDMAMEIVRNGGELPADLKAFIEKYYGSI